MAKVREVRLPDGTTFTVADWGYYPLWAKVEPVTELGDYFVMEIKVGDKIALPYDPRYQEKVGVNGEELSLEPAAPATQTKKEDKCVVCEGTFHGLTFLNGAMYCPRCNGMVHEGCTQKKDLWDGKGKRNYCLICFEQMEKK
jgi:hypothetical protein